MTASVMPPPCALGAELGRNPVPRRPGHDDLRYHQSFNGAQTSLRAVQHRVFGPVYEPGVFWLLVNIDASREYVGDGDRFRQGNSAAPRIQFDDCHDGPGVPQPYKRKPVGRIAATQKLHTNNFSQLRPMTDRGHAQLPTALALTGATPAFALPSARGFFFPMRWQPPARGPVASAHPSLPGRTYPRACMRSPPIVSAGGQHSTALRARGQESARSFSLRSGFITRCPTALLGRQRKEAEHPFMPAGLRRREITRGTPRPPAAYTTRRGDIGRGEINP
jgi:hypothetical protein